VDDVIVAEGEWGKVEEITLSYVVLHLWNNRRLVLPCTYFTRPYQNWARQGTDATGGSVSVRVLLTAHEAPTLWDLRCYGARRYCCGSRTRGPMPHPLSASCSASRQPRLTAVASGG